MRKIEVEKLLMRPEGLTVLSERATYLKNKYGENGTTGGEDAEKVLPIAQLAHELPQSAAEIIANDHDVTARSELMYDLSRFIPEFTDAEPRALLKTLTKKFKDQPTASNLLLLENVINKIASVGQATTDDERAIEDAIQVLMEAGKPQPGKGGGSQRAEQQQRRAKK